MKLIANTGRRALALGQFGNDERANSANTPPGYLLRRVQGKVLGTYRKAECLYGRRFDRPKIVWDLRGTFAGRANSIFNRIRLNPVLLIENAEDFISQTVPYEIAHLINAALHGSQVKPHGKEWQMVMRALGLAPQRCHKYDTTRARTCVQRRHAYDCGCRVHLISQRKHNRILEGWRYTCRRCGIILVRQQPKSLHTTQPANHAT